VHEHGDERDMGGEPGERQFEITVDSAGDQDDEVGVAPLPESHEHVREPVGTARLERREVFEQGVGCSPGQIESGTRVQPDAPAVAPQGRSDRSRRFDGGLERVVVVCRGSHVEDDRHARQPRSLVLAHDEPARTRRGPPVDASQLVAHLVVAQ
jgi:hypothetical protein